MLTLRAMFRSGLDLVLGEESRQPPPLPEGLPPELGPAARDAVAKLTDYQNAEYAQLYLSRLERFTRRRGISKELVAEIACLLAVRMRYSDPIWAAQMRLAQVLQGDRSEAQEAIRFPLEDIVALLPAAVAEGASSALVVIGRANLRMPLRFTARTRAGVVKLKAIALLRRIRLRSLRYPKERALVERWLHMIDRSLAKRPQAAVEVARTASIIRGSGEAYHRSIDRWHTIIDNLVKPVFDGAADVPDLPAAVARLRSEAEGGADRGRLLQVIGEIKSGAAANRSLA